ncbi:MAG: hypothetical protein AMJ94_19625 [Deltaproteobacteria bacterium SM23_61]|nr:MAG: hypothetical protein AMJ94_19625 [Deltaproteobacteria bacterium SM23_61]
MKSGSWFLIILRSLEPIKTFRVGRLTFLMLGTGIVLVAGLIAFGVYQYLTLHRENARLKNEISQLKVQVSGLNKKLSEVAPEAFPPLKIDDLQVIQEPGRAGFAARFWLVEGFPQDGPFTGTLAMVAKNEALRPPVYRVIPAEMKLEKGIPQEPGKGKPFEVKEKKFVEAFFDLGKGEIFQTLTVFIFSQEGRLIQQKSAVIPKP